MKESEIEDSILCWLGSIGVFAWKNQTAGYFDTKRGVFRKHKSKHALNGVSDILGIFPDGTFLAIEVKRKAELSFFMKSKEQLDEVYTRALARGDKGKSMIRKVNHALDQQFFIDKMKENKAIAMIVCSLKEVEDELKKDFNIT